MVFLILILVNLNVRAALDSPLTMICVHDFVIGIQVPGINIYIVVVVTEALEHIPEPKLNIPGVRDTPTDAVRGQEEVPNLARVSRPPDARRMATVFCIPSSFILPEIQGKTPLL